MKKCLVYSDWRQLGFWLAVVGFALVGGFALGWMWCGRQGRLSDVSILDVLTALGTVGATLVALGLHRAKVVAGRDAQIESARLYALEMRVSLQYFVNIARELRKLSVLALNEPLGADQVAKLSYFSNKIITFDKVLNTELAKLACLGKGISTSLAMGVSQTYQGALAAIQVAAAGHYSIPEVEPRVQAIAGAQLWIGGGLSLLERALQPLEDEAWSYAKQTLPAVGEG